MDRNRSSGYLCVYKKENLNLIERLGIIKDEEGNVLRHRTLLKIIFNPILRKFGWSIVSVFKNNKFIGYQIREYPKYCKVIK